MNKKKILARTIICNLALACLSIALGAIVTTAIAGTLAFRGCACNGDMLKAIAFIIECEDDCEIVKTFCDCEYGTATMLADPNDGGEPYLINLTVKEISPFTYEWVIVEE